MRFFNTAGPIKPEKHYCIPPLGRLGLDHLLRLIGQEKYFVLHAPRQTGKTSALLALRDHLNVGEDYREHSEHWVQRFDYHEAGPQLLLQAFLQRVVNAGGRIEREYGLGRMRTDLLIVWPRGGIRADQSADGRQVRRTVIECKLLYGSLERTIREGLEQTRLYMDRCGAAEGHLVIFDRTSERSWDEKIFRRTEAAAGLPVTIWGM